MQSHARCVTVGLSIILAVLVFASAGIAEEHSVAISGVSTYFHDPVLGSQTGGHCIAAGLPAEFDIHITNNGTPDCYWLVAMALSVCDGAGGAATWTDFSLGCENEIIWIDTTVFGVFHDTVFFCDLFYEHWLVYDDDTPQQGCQSAGFAGVSTRPPGLVEGLDADALKLTVTPEQEGAVICIDINVDDMPGFEWGWTPLAVDPGTQCTASDTEPDWGGPYCYTVVAPCCLPPVFVEPTPDTIIVSHCEEVSAVFAAVDPDPSCGPGFEMVYTLISGPGAVDSETGYWSWSGMTMADVGTPVEVTVQASSACMTGSTHTITVIATNDGPMFTICPSQLIVALTKIEGELALGAEDSCPEDTLIFYVVSVSDPDGDYFFEGNVLHYIPWTGSQVTIEVGVTDGVDSFEGCFVELVLLYDCCAIFGGFTGNTDCSEDGKITLSDVARLIDHIYISKESLCCAEMGDVNGNRYYPHTLSDISALIDHVYISKQPTAPCE